MGPSNIRVVVVRSGDFFVAQGLELDVTAQGGTPDEALERFGVLLRAEAREAAEQGRDLFAIGPGPAKFHALHGDQIVRREVRQVA
jgi:hypothetical protein